MVGITSSQFIEKMEKNTIVGDQDIVGLSKEDFAKNAIQDKTISGTIRHFRDMKMTEFGLGWSGRMIVEANMEARKELIGKLLSMGQREQMARNEKKLEYIG